MCPKPSDPDSPQREIALLRKQLRRSQREAEQWKRVADTSASMSRNSKRSMMQAREDLERIVADLDVAKRAAEEASASKSRFLAVMSHEIRTPLNGVLGTLELLLQSGLNTEQSELARISHESSTALLQIINDVLDYSKIEAGAMRLEAIELDVRELVDRTIETLRTSAEAASLSLSTHVDSRVPVLVGGDPLRLRQVLLNLVGNAIKFTPEGSVALRVDVCAAGLRFEVVDTGIGITADKIEHIFGLFNQEDDSTTRRFGGTGLGLGICKLLVELMDGRIGVESRLGSGSTFWFEIPVLAAGDVEASASSEVAPLADELEKLALHRVLVVDDNPVNRLVARKMLETLGVSVELAEDGVEAIERVKGGDFDVVFMDCSMPVLDGYEATRRIRALEDSRAEVPIIALTAFANEESARRSLDAGMDLHLSKPFRRDDLVNALKNVRRRSLIG